LFQQVATDDDVIAVNGCHLGFLVDGVHNFEYLSSNQLVITIYYDMNLPKIAVSLGGMINVSDRFKIFFVFY
jgi:hypothetical protein